MKTLIAAIAVTVALGVAGATRSGEAQEAEKEEVKIVKEAEVRISAQDGKVIEKRIVVDGDDLKIVDLRDGEEVETKLEGGGRVRLVDPESGEVEIVEFEGEIPEPRLFVEEARNLQVFPQTWAVGGQPGTWQILQTDHGVLKLNTATGQTWVLQGQGTDLKWVSFGSEAETKAESPFRKLPKIGWKTGEMPEGLPEEARKALKEALEKVKDAEGKVEIKPVFKAARSGLEKLRSELAELEAKLENTVDRPARRKLMRKILELEEKLEEMEE